MKILHLLNHTQRANGHVHMAVDLACAQAEQGHDVFMMAGPTDYSDALARSGVHYVELPVRYGIDTGSRASALRALPELTVFTARQFQRLRLDVVHSHMPRSALMAWAAGAPQRISLVTSVHNSFDRQAALMRFADRVVCVSEAVRVQMARRGVAANKLKVIYNGTRGSARLPEQTRPLEGIAKPAIACVAGLHGRKGVDDLIRAADLLMREHPTVHLYIAGSGPDELALRAQARATCAPERIVFLGHLDDPRRLLLSCDIFALASRADPFPLVVLEALEAGCAVVGTSVDGIPEALDHGRAGVLVEPRSPLQLYRALARLLDSELELERLQAAASSRAHDFSVTRMAAQYVDLYREVCA